ncbi:hypothetical protein D1007_37240 [Hordeum vulgare]|nr:hypothetical protein D1007_37240 [Hordeum vulgare]
MLAIPIPNNYLVPDESGSSGWVVVVVIHGGVLPMIRGSLVETRGVVGVAGVVAGLVLRRRKLWLLVGLVWRVGSRVAVDTGAGDHGGVISFPRAIVVGLAPLLVKSPLVVVGRRRLVVVGGRVVAVPVLAVPPTGAVKAAAAAVVGPLAAVVILSAAAETGAELEAHCCWLPLSLFFVCTLHLH